MSGFTGGHTSLTQLPLHNFAYTSIETALNVPLAPTRQV